MLEITGELAGLAARSATDAAAVVRNARRVLASLPGRCAACCGVPSSS